MKKKFLNPYGLCLCDGRDNDVFLVWDDSEQTSPHHVDLVGLTHHNSKQSTVGQDERRLAVTRVHKVGKPDLVSDRGGNEARDAEASTCWTPHADHDVPWLLNRGVSQGHEEHLDAHAHDGHHDRDPNHVRQNRGFFEFMNHDAEHHINDDARRQAKTMKDQADLSQVVEVFDCAGHLERSVARQRVRFFAKKKETRSWCGSNTLPLD